MRNQIPPALGVGGLTCLMALVLSQCAPIASGDASPIAGSAVPMAGDPALDGDGDAASAPSIPPDATLIPVLDDVEFARRSDLPRRPPPPRRPANGASTTVVTTRPAPTTTVAPAPTTVAVEPPPPPTATPAPPPPAPTTAAPPPPPPPTTAVPAPPPPPAPSPTGTPASDVVAIVNAERAAAGLAPLAEVGALTGAAQAHSIDQATMQTMTHTGSDGSDAGQRIARAGYQAGTWGENVAAGYAAAGDVMAGWMGSPGHRNNILNPAFTAIGVASAEAGDGTRYWTMVLAG